MSDSETEPKRRRPWTGRLIVVSFITVAVASVVGVALFRHHARARFGGMVEIGEAERIRAFTGLIRMNGLRSLAKRFVYLPPYTERARPAGITCVKTRDSDGELLYVLRGVDMDVPADQAGAQLGGIALVFSANGRVHYTVEQVALLAASGGEAAPESSDVGESGAAVVDAPAALLWGYDGERHWFFRALLERQPLLVVTGEPRFETASGIVHLGADGVRPDPEARAYLRWQPEKGCLTVAGPEAEASWQVDREQSPGFCAEP